MQKNKSWLLYLIPVVIFFISLGVSAFIFRRQRPAPSIADNPDEQELNTPEDDSLIAVDESLPRTEPCPLNGEYYTQPEKDSWSTRRPLAVMIENTPEARPQSGLSRADIVFEAVAEGGITRFMAMFYCDAQREEVTLGPVRSARTYFIDLASGFNRPMYVHVGGANVDGPTNALGQLGEYGWRSENDIDQFNVGYPTFVRDYNRIPGKDIATEHTMTTTTEKLWAVAKKRDWTNITPELTSGRTTTPAADWQENYQGWTFVDGQPSSGDQTISYNFWSGQPTYDVSWTYDAANNTYKRTNGGSPTTDLETDEQVAVTSVIVLFAKETGPINDNKHMLYDVVGKGDAILFANGQAEDIRWEKKTRESELKFTDSKGQDVSLPRGKIWISVLPIGNQVTY